jgi:hypothetical protein
VFRDRSQGQIANISREYKALPPIPPPVQAAHSGSGDQMCSSLASSAESPPMVKHLRRFDISMSGPGNIKPAVMLLGYSDVPGGLSYYQVLDGVLLPPMSDVTAGLATMVAPAGSGRRLLRNAQS